MQNKKTRLKGKGWFVNEYNKIYVCGTINGKFKRASTGMEATSQNLAWIKHTPKGELSNARTKLIELFDQTNKIATDFENFGRESIKLGAKKQKADGTWTKKGRAAQSQKTAEQAFEKHILPFFKNFKLEEINASLVEQWQEEKDAQGYATDTINKWTNYLKQIMDRAVKFEIVQSNKVVNADPIEVTHVKKEGFTVDEARIMMGAAEGIMKVWLPIAFTTGVRVGEELGLRVSDFDFEHSCVYLQRSITKGTITFSNSTKNHSRVVYILPYVAELIKEYIAAENKTENDWLFETNKGSYYRDSKTIDKYYLQPLLSKLNIKGTLGMTRKTFASIADGYVMAKEKLQETMGHRVGSSVTDNHYITPMMTTVKSKKGLEALSPINDVLFDKNLKEG